MSFDPCQFWNKFRSQVCSNCSLLLLWYFTTYTWSLVCIHKKTREDHMQKSGDCFALTWYSVPWIPYISAQVNPDLCVLYSAGLPCSVHVPPFYISGLDNHPVRGWSHHETYSVYFLSLRDHSFLLFVAQCLTRLLSYIRPCLQLFIS